MKQLSFLDNDHYSDKRLPQSKVTLQDEEEALQFVLHVDSSRHERTSRMRLQSKGSVGSFKPRMTLSFLRIRKKDVYHEEEQEEDTPSFLAKKTEIREHLH